MDAVARSMSALGGSRGEPRLVAANGAVNRQSDILSWQLKWALFRWGICIVVAVPTTFVLLYTAQYAFSCTSSPNLVELVRAWIFGATVRLAAGAAFRATTLLLWNKRKPPSDQAPLIWSVLRADAWLNIASALWVTIGVLFLFSPSLPCTDAPLVSYSRAVSVGLAAHMLWSLIANVILWAARRTGQQWLAFAVLWLSGASTLDLWERAGIVVSPAALHVAAVNLAMFVVVQQNGQQETPGLRSWLNAPGAGGYLSSADIATLPTFTFTQPPQQAAAAAGDEKGEGRVVEPSQGPSPPFSPPLFVSPVACGFPAGVVPDTACAICQCDYEAGDSLRVLPCSGGARHAFHRPCADTWLSMQATCPVCRSRILSSPPAPPVAAAVADVGARGTPAGPSASPAMPEDPRPNA